MTREEAVNKIKSSALMRSVIHYARKHGYVRACITGMEKWNNNNSESPGADGHYDVEGHQWTDINGYYTLKLWHPADLAAYLKACFVWFKELLTERSWSYSIATVPFKTTWSSWIWTIQSLETCKSDIVDDIAYDDLIKTHGPVPRRGQPRREWYELYRSRINQVYATISLDDVRKHMIESGDYVKLGYALFVCAADPTVIIVDEELYRYDLKDGWSDDMIRWLLMVYIWSVYREQYIISDLRIKSFNKMDKSIQRGMLDVRRGNFVSSEEMDKLFNGDDNES